MSTTTATPYTLSEPFLKAIKDRNSLREVMVVMQTDSATAEQKAFIRLWLDVKNAYSDEPQRVCIEQPVILYFENYSYYSTGTKIEPKTVCFFTGYTNYTDNHVRTYLDNIKKDSALKFKVVCYNGSDNLKAVNFTNHKLTAYIENGEKMGIKKGYGSGVNSG